MTIRNPPRPAGIVVVLLCALAVGAAPAQRDYVFRHENVLGTSLELCIRADSRGSRWFGRGSRACGDRPARGQYSAIMTRRANSAAGKQP